MVAHVDCCIMEAVHATTGVDFDTEDATRKRLRHPARMKGGGMKRSSDTRYPAFLGALLDILLRCIDRKDEQGKSQPGCYLQQLADTAGG